MKLLPIEFDEEELGAAAEANVLMNYEPNETEALDMIIPKYVTSLFYGALVEAVASENGARMQAMDSATSNAEDMISDLTLKYNRARQGSITAASSPSTFPLNGSSLTGHVRARLHRN